MNNRIPDCGTKNNLYSVGHYLDPYYRGIVLKIYNKLTSVKKNIVDTWEYVATESNNNSEVNEGSPESDIDEEDPIEKLILQGQEERECRMLLVVLGVQDPDLT